MFEACLAAESQAVSIADLLAALRARGIAVLYSSDLVSPQMRVTVPLHGDELLSQAREALGQYGLMLRELGTNSYLVTRKPAPVASPPPTASELAQPAHAAPVPEEVSVYGSRYTFGLAPTAEPKRLSSSYIDQIPGGHDDTFRATTLLPGVASNGSSQPYIRGASLDDVLVRFDGVSIVAPYHVKDFHGPVSAFDDSVVDRVDVYSGGYPVRYGTRSGGVIDISPPSPHAGSEVSIGASLLSFGMSSIGRAQQLPADWLVSIRHSSDDVGLNPINGQVGQPRFTDTLGRLRWYTATGAWTVGWLLLDDRASFAVRHIDESARARYRDAYGWVAYEGDFGEELHSRTVFALTNMDSTRTGKLHIGGFGSGNLQAQSRSTRAEVHSDWSWQPVPRVALEYGIEATAANAHLQYDRVEQFNAAVAAGFDRPVDGTLSDRVAPAAETYGIWSDLRHRWGALEGELGLRLDGQHFEDFASRGQWSPRINVSYDVLPAWRLFGSWGHFTQAQRVEDWRVETPQAAPDVPELAIETVLGVTYTPSTLTRISLEAHRKHWAHVSPYFDNPLERLSLVPDLAPDRLLIAPQGSEAHGVELSARRVLSEHLQGWASYSWSQVTDRFADQSVPRSWDQPEAASGGLSWNRGHLNLVAILGWHSGWPRTPFLFVPGHGAAAPELQLGARNSGRWGDYFSADLRAGWTLPLRDRELATWIALTNTTGRHNACCVQFLAPNSEGGGLVPQPNSWFPRVLNAGFAWRMGTVR